MTYNISTFLKEVEKTNPNEVVRIKEEIDVQYEINAYAFELERHGRYPILIFENVRGYNYTVVTNIFSSRKRYATALGIDSENLVEEWIKRESNLIKPRTVSGGPIHDVVWRGEEADLHRLPIITHFEKDAGPYITSGILVAKDPDTGVNNLSYHRLQLKGSNKLGVTTHSRRHLWDYQRRAEEKGEDLEVAVVIGAHPAVHFGSNWKGVMEVDEYDVVGGYLGEPLELVRCKTVDLEVPAEAEIVLEGRIISGIREPEGPFGELTGYMSHSSTNNVLMIDCITQRDDALYQDIVPGLSVEHSVLAGFPKEVHLYKVLKETNPTLKALTYPSSGACKYHCYISIKKVAEGQPKNVLLSALGDDAVMKLAVVVDDDIDVYDEKEVLWAMATRMQGDDDMIMIPGCMGSIMDPSSVDGRTTKIGLDATKHMDWEIERCKVSEEARRKVAEMIASGKM